MGKKTGDDKLKRVILFRTIFGGVSGVERITLEEAKYFVQKGIETHILTFDLQKDADLTLDLLHQMKTLNVEEIPYKKVSNELLQDIYKIIALRKRIKEIEPDITIVQELVPCPYFYLATLFTNFSYTIHIHDVPFQSHTSLTKYGLVYRRVFDEIRTSPIGGKKGYIQQKPPKMGLLKRARVEIVALTQYLGVRKAKKIFTLSNQVKWMIKKLYCREAIVLKGAFSKDKLDYQPKSNIKGRLGLSNKKMILNVNGLRREKRVDLLLRAFKLLSERVGNLILVICGTGSEGKKLKNLAEELDITDKVKFMGYISEEDLWDYYVSCDIFVHPFQGDFALSPYEALALQKNVVLPSEMELDEPLLKNKHIFISGPTTKSLAETMETALATRVSKKYDLSEYAWEKYTERIYTVCEDVTK